MAHEWHILKDQEMRKYQRNPQLYFEKNIQKGWDELRPGGGDKTLNGKLESQFDYFSDTYSPERLERDQNELDDRRKKFEKDNKKMGKIGEYIFMEGVYELQWLKPEIEAIPTHEYDDVMRQVDVVLKFESGEGETVYLGVDITTTKDEEKILDKRRKLKKYLEDGFLGSLEYFEDQDDDIKGQVQMPKIVVGFLPEKVIPMVQVMVNERIRRKLTPADRKNLLPEELSEFEKDHQIAKKIQADIEGEVFSQLHLMIEIVETLIQRADNIKDKAKYQKFKDAYKKVFLVLNEKKV